MNKRAYAVLGLYVVLFAASAIATHLGAEALGKWIAGVLVLLAGWAFFGHLVTIDHELPGGWSNPKGSRTVMAVSLSELTLKLVLFCASIGLFLQKP